MAVLDKNRMQENRFVIKNMDAKAKIVPIKAAMEPLDQHIAGTDAGYVM